MKRYTLYTFAALVLLLAATACTQDDAGLLPEASEGTPIVFTATGLTPATDTRATVDGDWEGVTSVAIQIGSEVKAYRGTGLVTVSAWWPCTDGETAMPAVVVQADQSGDGYAQSDHIGVAEELLGYNEGTPTLHFTHRTARISLTLSGSTSSDVSSVRLTNLSTADGNLRSPRSPAKRGIGYGVRHHLHHRRQDLRLPDAKGCQMDGRQRIRVCDND